jgi:hypothetical protein
VESNLNVPQTLPTKPRKSVRTNQKEWEKNYGTPAAEESKHRFPVDGIYSARQNRDMMRKVGRTDTIEVVATLADNNNEELVTTDTFADNDELVTTDNLAFYNKELVAATLAVYYEEIDAVATNLAAPKNNCDKSKMIAVEGYREEADIKSSGKLIPLPLQQASHDNKLGLELGLWMTKKASVSSIKMKTTTMQHLWKKTMSPGSRPSSGSPPSLTRWT